MTTIYSAMLKPCPLTFVYLCLSITAAVAFNNTRFDNLAVYWGQNSYGATHSDVANYQQSLSFYCGPDSPIDVFPIAFLHVFFGTGGLPSMNLANTCNPTDNATFPGTQLPDCSALASDIKTCQKNGKVVTLSLGGATGAVGFSSDSQAETFADTVWNMFLGGSGVVRPFGDAVLDGVDLDIEGGQSGSYAAFVNRIRAHAKSASKQYYITAAPQCPFPDAALGAVLNAAEFDAVYVQFYNNVCGVNNYNQAQNWNFGVWDNWARTISPNKNVKVYIGAPAAKTAAGSGYSDAATLGSIATKMRTSFPSFGGVMLWDASQAYANNRYDLAIKSYLTAAGGTGFSYPACSAPAYASGRGYTGGSQVSYQGFIWQAKFFASSPPNHTPNGEWSAISVCSGPATIPSLPTSSPSSTSTSVSQTSVTPQPSPTTSTPAPTPTNVGNCAGVAAWTNGIAYTGGQTVVYGGHIWTAKWWTQGDAPNAVNGNWKDGGPCTAVASTPSSRYPEYVEVNDSREPAISDVGSSRPTIVGAGRSASGKSRLFRP